MQQGKGCRRNRCQWGICSISVYRFFLKISESSDKTRFLCRQFKARLTDPFIAEAVVALRKLCTEGHFYLFFLKINESSDKTRFLCRQYKAP